MQTLKSHIFDEIKRIDPSIGMNKGDDHDGLIK